VADTERQSEIAARVSTWKERIEDALEEQVSFTKKCMLNWNNNTPILKCTN
jgi:hypothetical protein